MLIITAPPYWLYFTTLLFYSYAHQEHPFRCCYSELQYDEYMILVTINKTISSIHRYFCLLLSYLSYHSLTLHYCFMFSTPLQHLPRICLYFKKHSAYQVSLYSILFKYHLPWHFIIILLHYFLSCLSQS